MVSLAVTASKACGLALFVRVRACTSETDLIFAAAGGWVAYLLAFVALDDRVGCFDPKAVEANSDSFLKEDGKRVPIWCEG